MNLLRVIVNLFRFNRTNWKAVALCFIAAAVFWLFNALNKNYATNVRFPLQFEFDRAKYVASKSLPASVYLNVSGNGWDLFRKRLNVKLAALVVPLEHPVETRKIVGSTMPPLLASQLGNLKINHVVTDTLYLHIEPRDSGRYKLIVDASGISFKKGYGRISPIVVLPDSVKLEGPKSMISSMSDSLLITLPQAKLSANFREEIEVAVSENEFIKRNPPVVEVIFEVGEVVDIERKIKLELLGIPANRNIVKGADSVVCQVQVPKGSVEDFRQMTTIKASINLKGFEKGQKHILPAVLGLPPYAELRKVDSIQLRVY